MTLTIQDLGALGALLGSVAVLVTLVYLTLHTRQNTMAISAQLDAQRVSSSLQLGLTTATSTELQEALAEDQIDPPAINRFRRTQYWHVQFVTIQWQWAQAERGLLPTFHKEGMATLVRNNFNRFRSFEGWWETGKRGFSSEFVEWVEEQRSKAA